MKVDGLWLSMAEHDIYRVQASIYNIIFLLSIYKMAKLNGKAVYGNIYFYFYFYQTKKICTAISTSTRIMFCDDEKCEHGGFEMMMMMLMMKKKRKSTQ